MKDTNLKRIRLTSAAIVLFALLVIVRLFFVQVIRGEEYSENADKQYATPSSNVFDRGSIFFKDKDGKLVSAATLKTGYIVAINPKQLLKVDEVYNALSQIIPLEKEAFMAKATKKSDPYEEVARRVPQEQANKIKSLKIAGVSIYKEKWRFYPAGNMASNIIGFVAFKGEDRSGRYGLERQYNEVLSRHDGGLYVNFFAEVFSNLKETLLNPGKMPEGDVVTTIDPSVQSMLEKGLGTIMQKYSAEEAGGIIIDPKTGKIFAMGALPNFNLNNFGEVKNVSLFANPNVEKVYEMGSIIKALTMAAGLDSGAVTPTTKYEDKGYVVLNGSKIKNFDGKARGYVDMQEVLNNSLNTGVTFTMQKMGKDVFRSYMLGYGLGDKSGIDLPGEARSIVGNFDSTRDVEYATASFGQGIAMTPIVTARALSVLANGGYLVTPYVVEKIDLKDGLGDNVLSPPKGKQILKPGTSEEISRMLTKVVDKALLGGAVKMENYSIAAKTGTAQMAKENGGGYYEDKYLHSFFGYFPSYDPKFLVLLYTVNPQGERYASHTLTYPFIDLTKFLINYYDIPPDR